MLTELNKPSGCIKGRELINKQSGCKIYEGVNYRLCYARNYLNLVSYT